MLYGLAALAVFLSGFTELRFGDVQAVSVVIVLALAAALFQSRRAVITGSAEVIDLLPRVLLMLILIACGSVLSLRLTFYPPSDVGPLKQPPWATFARFIEVSISAASLFVVALNIQRDPRRLKLILAAYGWAAIANALWGLIAFGAHYAGVELPGITPGYRVPRIAGFFNEGGPLGVYLAGGALIQYIRGPVLKYISKRHFWASIILLIIAIAGSQSKAAVLTLILLAGLTFVQRRRIGMVFLAIALIIPVAIASNLVEGLQGYYASLSNFHTQAYEHSQDGNLVNGRLMAAVLLPRIVAAHPVLGVGIGNYSLVRNDPSILLGLPRTENWDLHGLGLLGYLAELGIPLTLFALSIYAFPLIRALRSRTWIFMLSSYPLLAALLGVQINFAYPWILMGIALATQAIARGQEEGTGTAHVRPPPPSIPPPERPGRATRT